MKTRKEQFPFGIPGVDLKTIEREVPVTEPPAWPINDKLTHVGKSVKRIDAILKVTGEAKYASDISLPGLLQGSILHSPLPAAVIKKIDTNKAENYPGVYGVHVMQDLHGGSASGGDAGETRYPEIKFAGQPIAAVAAIDQQTADKAVKLIRVTYQEKPFVVNLERAMQPDAPTVFKKPVDQEGTDASEGPAKGLKLEGNVRGPSTKSFLGGPRGDIEKGFAEANIIVEGEFRTQVQTHSTLETHGCVVDWKPDLLTIYASTQSTKSVKKEFATIFDLPESKVRVLCKFMGGGFGAKYGAGNFGALAAHLSKKTGRPVKLFLDRKAEHLCVGNRPNSIQTLKIGATKEGKLTAIKQESHGTAGVGLGAGVGRVAQALYPCPNFLTEQYDVFTNAGPGAAWRAPGNAQGAFAVEQVIDEIAEKLNMDPLAYRDIIDDSKVRKAERTLASEKFKWNERKPKNSSEGVVKKGVGVAQSTWPRIIDLDSTAEVRLLKDGTVEIRSGVQDIGTGTRTILAQVVAEEIGIAPEKVGVHIGDTYFPNGPASGGSRVSGSITPAARNAAFKAKKELISQVADRWKVDADTLEMKNGTIQAKDGSGEKITFEKALKKMRTAQISVTASRADDYGGFKVGKSISHSDLGSVQMAEVSVNTETGVVKVARVVAVHSCGRPINPLQIQSQVNGGVIQGVSYALYENREMDEATGKMINANLDQYKIAFAMEVPEIEVYNIEEYSARSSTDAYGIAEPANIATAAAIANAVYNATGVRIRELPITPDRVLNALNKV
ncbi:xanthine dehydrogenase family protein molybdopterin-binding subunit [Aquimarina sp. ERC-38]|uniref:xanthine dehydrogenase family protein molybdopterin-binding subunit n=1 Tax=Aquimarina sp. ERC-38 TaxID=2949996 RepID=UPI002245DAD4|nr:xanthine dehydrogenase family protein molybdopterin-binding subunit [Aquimarina sp. ERC-38]UZO81038.1 xanthine dehydrogenase family protein molybdopterin-binding subunit [Aquimarina sp. ERC-38]